MTCASAPRCSLDLEVVDAHLRAHSIDIAACSLGTGIARIRTWSGLDPEARIAFERLLRELRPLAWPP
jgi:hypothetical protein